jgi:nitrite reductase/ring-hydroxylating ferredoxin subunit
MTSKVYIFLLLFLLPVSFGCEKEDESFPVIYVNMNLLLSTDLNDVGVGSGKKFRITGSADSVIVVRTDVQEYTAYSDICPNFQAEGGYHQVRLDASRQLAECPFCHSRFLLAFYGNQIEGSVSPRPLHAFRTRIEGARLYISN